MKSAVFAGAVLVLLAATALARGEATTEAPAVTAESPSSVVVLTDLNFEEEVRTKGADLIWLVKFYAPWCGHCKSMAPAFEKAAERLKAYPKVRLGKLDATVETVTAGKEDLQGYPTLKVYRDGKVYTYDGGRSEDEIVAAMVAHAQPDWKPPVDAVIELTNEKEYDDFVRDNEVAMVEFYAPWCGHCKTLAPHYEAAAKRLQDEKHNIKLAKIDATKNQELSQRIGVRGYPTILIFRKGEFFVYEGERTAEAIYGEMVEQKGPAAKKISTVFDVDKFIDSEEAVFVGFFEKEDDPALTLFQNAASIYRKTINFAYTTTPSVIEHFKGVKTGTIVMFQSKRYQNKYEPSTKTIKPEGDMGSLASLMKESTRPLVGLRRNMKGKDTYADVVGPVLNAYFEVSFTKELFKDTKYFHNILCEVAKDFKGKVTFAMAHEEEYQHELKSLGLFGSDAEIVVAIKGADGRKYRMEEEFSAENLREFVEAFVAGKLKPYLMSEPIPKEDDGHVKVVVGKTFEKIVNDPTKDVLIEFYAPWCGHCKSLAPEWRKLAKKLHKVQDVVIAKIDATANDFPPLYKVDGYPTVYFVPKDQKNQPINYEEGRTADEFLEFLRKKSSAKIPKFKKKETTTSGKDEL